MSASGLPLLGDDRLPSCVVSAHRAQKAREVTAQIVAPALLDKSDSFSVGVHRAFDSLVVVEEWLQVDRCLRDQGILQGELLYIVAQVCEPVLRLLAMEVLVVER